MTFDKFIYEYKDNDENFDDLVVWMRSKIRFALKGYHAPQSVEEDDILQLVLIKFYVTLKEDRVRPDGSVKPLLSKMIRHIVIDSIRHGRAFDAEGGG